MKTEVKDINPTRKTITVAFSAEETQQEEARLVAEFRQHAKIPGFRPGKAPENMVRMRFAKDIVNDLRNRLVNKAHQDGLSKEALEIFEIVDLEPLEAKAGESAAVVFTVDVVPEFELPAYKGIAIPAREAEATEADIDAALNGLLEQRAEYNVVERAAEQGDFVRCGYVGRIGDDLVSELVPDPPIYGSQAVTWEEAGADEGPGIKAISDGLVGMAAGDEKVVTMDFAEDFTVEALRGKSVSYTLKVEEVREKKLPEIDEAFLQGINIESEAALRERIKADLEQRKANENAAADREAITQSLLDSVDFPIPESGIESETQELLTDFIQRNMEQGITAEQFEANKEQLHDGASKAAAGRVKSRLILMKIAEAEKIKVENDDMSRMIMHQAYMSRTKPDKLVKELQKDQGRIQRMRRDVLLGKTMEFLLESAERGAPAAAEV